MAGVIRVERSEAQAGPGAAEAFLATLDSQHGAWLGCDVAAEGLYERRSMGCAEPSLGFYLDGNKLRVLALAPVGHALLEHVRLLAESEPARGGLLIRFATAGTSPHPVITFMRKFLALFAPAHPELALFGVLSFDYGRLAGSAALPDDGKRRMALFFPQRVLVTGDGEAKWVIFRFPELKAVHAAPSAVDEPLRFEHDADDLPQGGHASRVREGVGRLREGGIYSLVLSQTFRRRVSVKSSVAFDALRRLNPYPAMFFLNLGAGETLFGASPDVQVRADATYVESAPVCGTYRRGADAVGDADQALALLNSDKEDAALAACADSDRNDKSTVCKPGSLELVSRRQVHFFSTIIHTIDHTRGLRRDGADVFEILLAHSSPATVTGMPKPSALRAIEEIESTWRGWYAGAVARLGSDGSMEAFTVLRAARVAGCIAEVRTGGNLLVDSDPDKEEEETRLKAETLFRVLGGESPRPVYRPAVETGRRVAYYDGGDPMSPLLIECLASMACEIGADTPGSTVVLGDSRDHDIARWAASGRQLLAVGAAGLALVEAQGGRLVDLVEPRYARRLKGQVLGRGFLPQAGAIELGVYMRQVIEINDLPNHWQPCVVTPEGWVLAAWSSERPQVAILCRPDSVQSIKNDAGRRLLRGALAWLEGNKVLFP